MNNSNSKRVLLQTRFSKLLLDLAERTQWKWGPFEELNSIRADQRRNVENYASGHGIPNSVNIRIETLTLVELISAEKLIPFKEAITSALPEICHDSADFEESYRSIVEGSFSGGFMHVGRITRSDAYHGAGTVSKSDSLPPSVRLLDLEIRKVFSSLAFLYITAHLDIDVTDEIVEKIRNPALPVFRITKLFVKNPWILGWRLDPVDVSREVARLLTDIGSDISAFLGIDRIRESTERFSARQVHPIVTYSATGGPADRDQIKPWLAENKAWLDEGQFLWPQYMRPQGIPSRIQWIKTAFDAGTPIALAALPTFSIWRELYAKKTNWDDRQLGRRINHILQLPDAHSNDELMKIARAHFPDGSARSWKLLVAFGIAERKKGKGASGVAEALRSARYRAKCAGRLNPAFEDVEAALQYDHGFINPELLRRKNKPSVETLPRTDYEFFLADQATLETNNSVSNAAHERFRDRLLS